MSTARAARRRAVTAAVVLAALLGTGLAGCAAAGPPPAPKTTATSGTSGPDDAAPSVPPSVSGSSSPVTTAAPSTSADPSAGTALTLLATLQVAGRAPQTGYDRDLFGQRWADTDRNGCDTRNDVLRRDLTDVLTDPGTAGCVVLSGLLDDPYTGQTTAFVRGRGTSELVQVDHVVALSDAWQKGAQQWSPQQRVAFANDPMNLLAVDGPTNQAKGDGDAATWLPPDRSGWCGYVARQVSVKARYGLRVTQAERDAAERVLATCPDEPALTSTAPTTSDVGAASSSASPTVSSTESSTVSSSATAPAAPDGGACDPAYPGVCVPPVSAGGDLDCGQISERRFVVLAPDPHHLDGDGNGTGCESG